MSLADQGPGATPTPGSFYRSAWKLYLAIAIIGVLWLGYSKGDLTLELFVDRQQIFLDLLLGCGSGLLMVLLWELGRRFLADLRELEATIAGLIGPIEPAEVIALALISGFAEELLFRGAMLSSWGFWVATLFFGLIHSGPGRPFRYWTAFALLAGALFGLLVLYRDTLLPAIVAHVLVNGINLWRLTQKAEVESC